MPRWDMLVAAAILGGAILIESGHRIDTSVPDDEVNEVVASAPADCTVVYAVDRTRMREADERALHEKLAAAAPPECRDR